MLATGRIAFIINQAMGRSNFAHGPDLGQACIRIIDIFFV